MSKKTRVERKMSVKPNSVKLTYVKPINVKPEKRVPFENGFHFYTDIGKYTGITATSLSEFALKLQVIPTESVMFHFQRKDFQNWIKYTIKDAVLAQRIDNSKREQNAERLRKELVATIEARNNHTIPT
ncbi:MAG: DUF5752 family protein [Candidatus Wukongarchaeota archaeon]|nr:DUF5752 family protein [Candidatus Wukongarchaeota archaeon]